MTRDAHIQTIDLALRTIAKRRSALDAEEARWLREADTAQIWRALGMVSLIDYLERALGYTPRMATERVRVAHALAELPRLAQALADGTLPYSALREVTRVATPRTEAAWRDAAIGKNMREIEELVATRKPGDRPDDPGDPDLRPRTVRFDVSPETYARLREAHAALDAEHGDRLDDDRFVAALCGLALDGVAATGTESGRAKFQIATTVCERCDQGWQSARGAEIAVGAAAVARARCDAQHVGSLRAEVPARATQDVTPKTRRFVWRRDQGRCVVPGCRSARNLEIHHLIAQSDGGTHDASNLCLLCSAHHAAHHAGSLAISGVAPDRIAFVAPPMAGPVGAEPARSSLAAAIHRVEARAALVGMGWKSAIASAAVDQAIAHVGVGAELGEVIRAALRCCPRART